MSETKKNKSRLSNYTAAEKFALIKAVQSADILWDLKHKHHYDNKKVKCAWDKVAALLRKDWNECMYAWRSLLDSYRYYRRRAEKKLIRSGIAQPSRETINASVDWEFAQYMHFYQGVQKETTKGLNIDSDGDASMSQSASDISSSKMIPPENDNSFIVLDDGSNFFDEEAEFDANISVDEKSYYHAMASKKQRTEGQSISLNRCRTDNSTSEKICINDDEEENSDNLVLREKWKSTNVISKYYDEVDKTFKEQLTRNDIDIGEIKLEPNINNDVIREENCVNHSQQSEEREHAFKKISEKGQVTHKRKLDEIPMEKPKTSQKLAAMIEKYLQKQLDIDSAPSSPLTKANLPALQYWDSLLNSMTPAEACSAQRAVTELLLARAHPDKH